MHHHTGPRQSPIGAAEKRAATQAVTPYLDIIRTCQERASFFSGVLSVRPRGDMGRESAASALAELLRQVSRTRQEFETEVADLPRHGRIEDVRKAFDELEARLKRIYSCDN